MQFKQRRAGEALIIDCAGVGTGLAAMPLKKAVDDAIAEGHTHLILNLSGVTQTDAVFLRGISSAYTATQRAEGNLVITGIHNDIKDAIARHGQGLWLASNEAEARQKLFPGKKVVSGDTQVAILGNDPFLTAAFHGISHYKERVTFHFFSNPGADLPAVGALNPRALFVHPQVGLTGIRSIRLGSEKLPGTVLLFGIGTPKEHAALRAMVTQERYDDYLEIPFSSEELVMKGLDVGGFRQLLAKKLDLMLGGWYDEQRAKLAARP